MAQQLSPPVQLMQMLFGFAAELGIADLVINEAKTAEELAQQTNMHPRSLYRLLRACANVGVFHEDEVKRFSLTPLAEPLLSHTQESLRAFATMINTDWQFETSVQLP